MTTQLAKQEWTHLLCATCGNVYHAYVWKRPEYDVPIVGPQPRTATLVGKGEFVRFPCDHWNKVYGLMPKTKPTRWQKRQQVGNESKWVEI